MRGTTTDTPRRSTARADVSRGSAPLARGDGHGCRNGAIDHVELVHCPSAVRQYRLERANYRFPSGTVTLRRFTPTDAHDASKLDHRGTVAVEERNVASCDRETRQLAPDADVEPRLGA